MIRLSDYELKLSKKGWLINILLLVIVTLIGVILLLSGLNNAFYSSSGTAQSIFKIITYLGEPIVFIVVVAVFYIVYDKKFAKNLAVSLLITVYLNELLKDIFKDPRPSTNKLGTVTPENPEGLIETSYGFPSGHTQSAVGTWGYVAYQFKDKPKPLVVPIIMGIITFLVAISRVIIGVHDLQDIVGGFAFGLGALLLFIYLEPMASKQFNKLSMNMKIVFFVVASLVLFLVGVLLYPTSGMDLLPEPNRVPFSDTGNFALVGGVVLGFGIGYVLEHEKIKYEPSKLNTKQKIIALIIGLVLVFVVYFALEAPKGIFDSVIYRYVRYALISFILIYFLPYIYKKIWKF